MAGLFSRLKIWKKNENFKSADINAEFNNVINNIGPSTMSGYSTNVSQMQSETTPGAQGSESLSQTTSDEISRLRYVVRRLIGGTYWYDAPTTSLDSLSSLVNQNNTAIPAQRIQSGRMRTTSNQPIFLKASGAAASVTLKAGGSNPNFLYRIDNTEYTLTADVTLGSLSTATAGDTADINDGTLAAATATKIQGEGGSTITYDNPSAGWTSRATPLSFHGFKVVHSAVTEYFFGYVLSNTSIGKCFRGYFFDSSDAPVDRIGIADNDQLTRLQINWIFLNSSGVLAKSANNPTWSFDQPSSPATNDYWFDFSVKKWKTYNGAAWVDSLSVLIGLALCDASNCIATRSFDFYAPYDELNTIIPETEDNSTLRAKYPNARVNVAGNQISFGANHPKWVMPTDLETGAEASSTTYHVYLKDTGDRVLSVTPAYNRLSDLGGWYHPHNPWRSIGTVLNDGSSNFSTVAAFYFPNADEVSASISTAALSQLLTRRARANGVSVGVGDVALSTNTASYTNNTASFTDICSCSVRISSVANPVLIIVMPKENATATVSSLFVQDSTNGSPDGILNVEKDAAQICIVDIGAVGLPTGSTTTVSVLPFFMFVDFAPTAGSLHNYKFRGKRGALATNSISAANIRMLAFELG